MSSTQILWALGGVLLTIVICVVIVAAAYGNASSAANVLGVVLPAVSGLLGLLVGGGAGHAVGSAGKQASDQKLAQASTDASNLDATLKNLFGELTTVLESPAGSDQLVAHLPTGEPVQIPRKLLDEVSSAASKLSGSLSTPV